MISSSEWTPYQTNLITFVLVDSDGNEVSGLGTAFTLELSTNAGAFAASAGTKAEISDGWYAYTATAGESVPGVIAIKVTHASIAQQNLEYVVSDRSPNTTDFTYTITDANTSLPIEGVTVRFSTDAAGSNTVWIGTTDSFGVARDAGGSLPSLDDGTYYVWRNKAGYTFDDPDTEVVG